VTLAEYVAKTGITVTRLAEDAEASRQVVRVLIKGGRTKQRDVAERVAAATGDAVSADDLHDPRPVTLGPRRG
jgi:plasmid maintenance system antidote protein VapI